MKTSSRLPYGGASTDRMQWQPTTQIGRWSVALAVAAMLLTGLHVYVLMPLSASGSLTAWQRHLLPCCGLGMVVCGFTAGVAGLFAILQERERSWWVMLSLLPLAGVLVAVVVGG